MTDTQSQSTTGRDANELDMRHLKREEILDLMSVVMHGKENDYGIKKGDPPPNYVPSDKEVRRGRFGRAVSAGIFFCSVFFLVVIFLSLLGANFFAQITIGLALTIAISASVLHRFLKIVPIYQALITNDVFTGDVIVYGPGLHFSYPWEEAHRDGNHALLTVTKTIEETIATEGDELTVKLVVQYMPFLHNLQRFKSMGISTIEEALTAGALAKLSGEAAKKPAEETRREIEEIGRNITEAMRSEFPAGFGVLLVKIEAKDIDYSADVQKARSAETKTVQVKRISEALDKMDPTTRKLALATMGDIDYKVIDVQDLSKAAQAALAGGNLDSKED